MQYISGLDLLWLMELAISFGQQVLLLSCLLLLIIIVVILKRRQIPRRWLSAAVLAAVAILFGLSPFLTTARSNAQTTTSDTATVRFAQFNKLYSNHDTTRTANYLSEQAVDVAVIEEVTEAELRQISQSSNLSYYYFNQLPRPDTLTAVGIISRFPLSDTSGIALGDGYSIARAVLRKTPQSHPIAVYGIHMMPPLNGEMFGQSTNQMSRTTEIIADEALPTLVGGDFNTSVLSPKLRQFNGVTSNTIRPTTTGLLPPCSWFGYGTLLCLRIDHIYIPVTAKLKKFTISPDLGSDHRMLIAEIAL